jgi:hypothetical protein
MHVNLKAKEHEIDQYKALRYLTKFNGLNLVFFDTITLRTQITIFLPFYFLSH